ncbi:hypothetical protein ACF082_10225 [Streptomyces lydicus]|uniref:hypothetical protein n=1 Tax=Streptomyces lydicus TaxID=47763 RepID=UPI0036F5148B
MPRLSCHFPITVTVVGEPSPAAVEKLGRVVEEALAARFTLARRHLETVTGRAPAAPVQAGETLDRGRIGATGQVYRVPAYDGGGALRSVRLETAQPRQRDPATLSDTDLEAEYGHARDWLLGHQRVDAGHAATKAYLETLEAELLRRTPAASTAAAGGPAGSGPRTGGTGPPPRTPVAPPPAMMSGGHAGPHDEEIAVTGAHAGGAYGEHDLPFLLGARGIRLVITSSGPGAHTLTGHGFDSVGVDPQSGELLLYENKSSGSLGKAEGKKATSVGKNLRSSLEEAIAKIRKMPDFPEKADVLHRLDTSLSAVKAGKPIPPELKVRLKLTNAGGYAHGARNLPPGVEYEDVVGPEVREARRKNIADAEKDNVSTSRPRSHADTEAMRVRVGGAMSRQPVRVPLGVRIRSQVRSAGLGLARIGAMVLWNAVMSKVDQAIENRFLSRWAEPRLKAFEPEIQARLDDRLAELVDLQLRRPGQPLYAVVSLLTTLERGGEDDTELESCEIQLVSVSVAAERVERSTVEYVRTHPWHGIRVVRDLVRTSYSVELEPLGTAELAAVLRAEIAAEEAAAGARSAAPEQERASQRRRDELAAQLARLEPAP